MKRLLYIFIIAATAITSGLGLSSCRKEVGTTAIFILDSVRHYYPIVMGEEISMIYRVANIGKEPLVITDIQPSCGCTVADGNIEGIIPPGEEGKPGARRLRIQHVRAVLFGVDVAVAATQIAGGEQVQKNVALARLEAHSTGLFNQCG